MHILNYIDDGLVLAQSEAELNLMASTSTVLLLGLLHCDPCSTG